MRKVLTTVFATAVALSAAAPASAEPARASSAAAYGITVDLAGTALIAPTPTASAVAPPDDAEDRTSTLPVSVEPVTLTGAVNAVAQARQADELLVALTPTMLAGTPVGGSEPITLAAPNARGYASAANSRVVLTADPGLPEGLFELIDPAVALVSADAIQAEAVAKCVDGRPQFDTGFNVTNLQLAGTQIPLVGDLLNTILDLFPEGSPLSGLLTVTKGEVITYADGVGINALHVELLGVAGGEPLVDVVIGHAEVHMPTDCGIAPPPPPAPPTGPGPIADLGTLAATGGDFSVTPLVAMVMLGAAFGIRRLTVRAQRSSSTAA